MTRTVLIGIAGAVIVAVALVLNDTLNETPVTEDSASSEQTAEAPADGGAAADGDAGASGADTATNPDTNAASGESADGTTGDGDEPGTQDTQDTQTARTGGDGAAAGTAGEGTAAEGAAGKGADGADRDGEAGPTDRPTFDVVRISKEGDTVIAGRAPPGSKVTIFDGESEIGSVTADSRGEWVYLPSEPLKPGSHQLSLRAVPQDGEAIDSDSKVVLVVPEPGKDIAGRPTSKKSKPLALLVPKGGADGGREGGDATAGADEGAAGGDDGASGGGEAAGGDARRELGARVLQKPSVPGSIESDSGDLALDSVDYDEAGNVSLGGRGLPGTEVRAYLDNRLIGRAEVPPTGLWRISPDETVDPGSYTLRLDMVGEDGDVAARVELPFTQSSPMRNFSGDSFVVVQPGNSLWRIARRTMNSGLKYTVIYQANQEQIRDPDLIYPGQIFEIPGN